VNTNLYKKYQPPPLTKGRNNEEEKRKSIDIEQIYGHGPQRGSMPGMTMPADCRSKLLLQKSERAQQLRVQGQEWSVSLVNCD
jgi:hypothetical protein